MCCKSCSKTSYSCLLKCKGCAVFQLFSSKHSPVSRVANVFYSALVSKTSSSSEVTHNLAPGDMVEVAEGELVHLQGKIISIDGNKVTMLPKHEDLKVHT